MSGTGTERLQALYLQMCRIRWTEQALALLWRKGLVSGEMHLGVGEEAVVAGVVAHLDDRDAMALDYRSTPALVARGVDLTSLLLEVVGSPSGLCGGRGGHMHLMSRQHLAAASGVVGAPGPLACGFGLAARTRAEGGVAVAFFGDGAVNEGMLMESLNLAAVWGLPVVFVCKDNRWAVTTRSSALTGGGLRRRLGAFGMPVEQVDGRDVEVVTDAAGRAVARGRAGRGPTVVLATCPRPEGHFLGDPLVRLTSAVGELAAEVRPLLAELVARPGAPLRQRLSALTDIGGKAAAVAVRAPAGSSDPVRRAARRLPERTTRELTAVARGEVEAALGRVFGELAQGA
jgi:pyruvate dehydrogenase E1 component alpha subunit